MRIRNLVLILLPILLLAALARAGGGPETTLVVVNADSPMSRRVANLYVDLRGIPGSHVVHLDDLPYPAVIPLDTFLERIWNPVREQMRTRGIEDRIDLIAYSVDFPYGVDFRKRLGEKAPRGASAVGGIASLTGVTYLVRHVEAGSLFWNLTINRYFGIAPGGGTGPRPRPATSEERSLFGRAQQAARSGRYTTALDATTKLLETYDVSPMAWLLHAAVLVRLQRRDEALKALEEATRRGPLNPNVVRNNLGPAANDPRFRPLVERAGQVSPSFLPARGFSSTVAWDDGGSESADRYYLSTMLGWSGPYGNSYPEIEAYLRAAKASDFTRPDGTVYICKNGNVRSTAREPFFGSLVSALEGMGRKVAILEAGKDKQTGILPVGKGDVIGAVVGSAGFKWKGTGSKLLPGAIAEHLTSFGAHFGTAGQTKLSEFLRYGAAGSSGTVMEPLALHQKFPNPMVHAYYAQGCSLAEAFYRSVWGPYQLLVVGDGLAQPFAVRRAPRKPASGTYSGKVTFPGTPRASLWIDGQLVAEGEQLAFDSTAIGNGVHDFRLVEVGDDAIETRASVRWWGEVRNGATPPAIAFDKGAFVSPGAKEIEVSCQGRVVAGSKGDRCEVPLASLGPGPVTLRSRVSLAAGGAWSAVERVEVATAPPRKSRIPAHPRSPGLRGTVRTDKEQLPVIVTHLGDRSGGERLREQLRPFGKPTRVELGGEIEVPQDGWYQFTVRGRGVLSLTVAGEALCEDAALDRPLYLPISLAGGWHPIRIAFVPEGAVDLEISVGGDQVTAAPTLRHGSRPALKKAPVIEGFEPGKPIAVPAEGLELSWRSSMRDIRAITLVPAKGVKEFPTKWVVEATTSRRFKPVKDLVVVVAPAIRKPKEGKAIPLAVHLEFKPLRAKKLRIRPVEGTASLVSLTVLSKEKKRR